jgi:hypothetical protein
MASRADYYSWTVTPSSSSRSISRLWTGWRRHVASRAGAPLSRSSADRRERLGRRRHRFPDRLVLELRAHRFRDLAGAVEVLKAVADAECITVKVRVAADPRPELARRCNAAPGGLGLVW